MFTQTTFSGERTPATNHRNRKHIQNYCIIEDAKKEFAATSQIGFGLDGEQETKQADFEAVRGKFEENSFILDIENHIVSKTELGDELIGRMEKLS